MASPLISVIIPVYNGEKYLRECVQSVLTQTFSDFEVIIVDDGSTDSSLVIARELANLDDRIRIHEKSNGGLSDARNAGIRETCGEYLTFVDCDDLLYPWALEILIGLTLRNRRQTKLVYADMVGGKSLPPLKIPNPAYLDGCKLVGVDDVVKSVLYQKKGYLASTCGKLYHRSLFKNHSFRTDSLYEDLDIFYKLAFETEEIAIAFHPVYFYRENFESITHTFSPRRFDVLDVTARIEDYMRDKHPNILPAARDRRLSANFNMFGLIAANDSDRRYEAVADGCWEIIKKCRLRSLMNPHVRMKNKLGIMLSYLGRRATMAVLRKFYRGRD